MAVCILQVPQHPGAEITDVHCALTQIGVLHALKMPNVTEHDLTECALRPLTGFYQRRHLSAQRGIVQNAQINPKQSAIFGTQLVFEVLSNLLNITANARQRFSEGFELSPAI